MLSIYQFLSGLLGIFIHAAIKIMNINKRTPDTVPIGSVFSTYFRKDFPTLMLSVGFIFVEIIAYHAYMHLNSETDKIPFVSLAYQGEVKIISCLLIVGLTYMAESIIMAFTGVSEKFINKKAKEG
jgi:hypothetical protein